MSISMDQNITKQIKTNTQLKLLLQGIPQNMNFYTAGVGGRCLNVAMALQTHAQIHGKSKREFDLPPYTTARQNSNHHSHLSPF